VKKTAITKYTRKTRENMNITQLSQRVQFVVDAEGHKSAVLVSLDDWEHLLILLEDLEDAEEIRRARAETKRLFLGSRQKLS
jgi:PHD/YefM family antitoxin component YafN of YafNO toxin-antitoxin module